ncbi:MAG: HPr family phosphocarrier protein [Deltaproteobacteria bacterium]|nr:HPr family phosphocarrier protein [Deltaproteobacteria bacterium]
MTNNHLNNISFTEKAKIFSEDYLKSCIYISKVDVSEFIFTEKLLFNLIGSSQILEDFLDFHGARNNETWYLYRELSAAVRHLSRGCYYQKHISNSLDFYNLTDIEVFRKEGDITLDFLTQTLIDLAPVITDEACRLKIPIPEKSFKPAKFPSIVTTEMLAYNIDDTDRDQQKKNIVKIASDFLQIIREFEPFESYGPRTAEEIKEIVPERINEVLIGRFEMMVHNLQSSFDTYVIHGGFRLGNKKLKTLRGIFSVVFHLLQTIGRLLHFYERHLHDAGYKNIYQQVQNRLSAIIDPDALLDRTINYGLFYICNFLSDGKTIAIEILNENIEKSSITVGIPVKLGFHSRPSMMVAKIVQHYGGNVEMCVGKDRFDAGSVLDMQWAGGKIQKENITEVIFEGDIRSLHDIKILASVNYGEDSMGKGVPLPNEIKHLR